MTAALELHAVLSLKLDARDAYRLAHAYRSEVLAEAADSLRQALTTMVADDFRRPGIAFSCGALVGFAAGGAVAGAGKDIRGGIQPSADESTQPTGAFERVTVYLTAASSSALVRAVETIGDSKTDTINRAIQTYALMASEVADGGRVLVRHQDESTQPVPARVWHVFDEDTAHATPRLYASEEAARLGTITRYEEMEGVCPDYSWRLDDDVWELLAGGEPVGIYFAPVPVTGEPEDDDAVYADVPDEQCPACGCIDPGCTTCTSGNCHKDDPDEWVRCSSPHCPNCERYEKATERGWVNGHMDSWHCPDHAAQPAEGEVPRG